MTMMHAMRDGWRAVVRRPMSNLALVLVLGGALALTATGVALTGLLTNTAAPRDTHEALYRFGVGDDHMTGGDELLGYRDDLGQAAELVAYRWNDFNLAEPGGDSAAVRTSGLLVDGRLFAALGWTMQQGRGFLAEDFAPGAGAVVVIGDALWRSRFGADPGAIGKLLRVDGQDATIVGVLPPRRAFPFQQQLYRAVSLRGDAGLRERNWWAVTWLPEAEAKEQFAARMAAWQAERESRLGSQAEQASLRLSSFWFVTPDPGTQMVSGVLKILIVLLLLLAAVNAGGLLLVQWLARSRELATRQALGAPPLVAVGNLVAQAVWLGAISAAVGLMLAWGMVAGLNQYLWNSENGIPLYQALRLSPQVLGVTVLATVLALAVLVLPTARRLWRGELATDLRAGLRSIAGLSRFGRGLFGLQCLLAVAAVAVALLAAEGARRALDVDLGVDTRNVLVAEFQSSSAPAQQRFARGLRERLAQRPEVEAVSVGANVPAVVNSNRVLRYGEAQVDADYAPVDAGYPAVYRLGMRQGRWFTDEEMEADARVAVLDPTLALALFDSEDVIGRSFEIEEPRGSETYRVIGLSEPVRLAMRGGPDRPSLFVPFAPQMRFGQTLAVRMRDGSLAHVPQIAQLARQIDPDVALDRLGPYADQLWQQAAWSRFVLMLFAPLGGFALALAATGLAALLGALVAQQVREIGVRRALGANACDIARSMSGRLLLWGGAGTGLGLAGVLLVSMPLGEMLYGETGLGLTASVGALLAMALALLAAAALPLRRALAVPPMEALRSD